MVVTFAELVRGVESRPMGDDPLLRSAEEVRRNYLVLMTGRSGSSWLVGLLSGRLGFPGEFLNPAFVRDIATGLGATNRLRYLRATQGQSRVGDVYGLKATSEHLRWFGADLFLDTVKPLTVFSLWRDNLVAQALSVFRATETGHFHSSDGIAPANPAYDGNKILRWLRYMAKVENDNFDLLREYDLPWQPLIYERMVADPAGTLRCFYAALGMDAPDPLDIDPSTLLAKVTESRWAAECEERFRAEHADALAAIGAERIAGRHLAAPSIR